MAAFRPIPPMQIWLDDDGNPLAGGYFEFLEEADTTPKDVFSDEALSVNLGNIVTLDASGRLPSDVWGSGTYRIRLYDVDDVLVDEADPVQEEGTAGASIPSQSGNSGKFLTTNGTAMSWSSIRQVADPTGHSGKVYTSDGAAASWQTPATVNQPDFASTATTFRCGAEDASHFFVQKGSGTAIASGTPTTSLAVTFPTAFTTLFTVLVIPTSTSQPGGPIVAALSAAPSTTGFTAVFDVAEGDPADQNIGNPVTFDWIAFGLLTDPT